MAEEFLATTVSEVINRLISFGIEEIGLVSGVKKEVSKLQGTLNKIQAVLQDAERKQLGSEAVRLWLKDLKEIAYDAEDILDEITYEDLRCKIENQTKNKVRNFFSHTHNPLALRFKNAHKINAINQKLDEIVKEKEKFHLINEGLINVNGQNVVDRETSSFVDDLTMVGRGSDVSKLVDLLIDEPSNPKQNGTLSVIPIVGLGGLGKTTLAQLLYNNEDVGKHFDLKLWVCVSDDFIVTRLLTQIIDQIPNCKCQVSTLNEMQTILQKELNGKKLLLVLDDVWNEDHDRWDTLNLSLRCAGTGSKIIVTTRSNLVASIMGTLPPYYLQMLSEDDCWTVFERRAFQMGGAKRTSSLEAIGREIVKKCGGLPLAAKSLGGLMHSKREEQEWLDVLNNEIWNMHDGQNKIIGVLKLSYNNLPPPLKQCFSYCSIFPKDYVIEKETLIQLWMAQGFLKTGKRNELMEDVGNRYFNDLCLKSFFQDVEKDNFGGVLKFKMHDLIHDLAQSITKSECRVVEATNIDQEDLCACRHISMLTFDEGICSIPSVIYEAKKMRSFFIQMQSLFCYSNLPFPFDMVFKLKLLRVLDLRSNKIKEVPSSISKLKHLRYLDLSDTDIQVLPQSVTRLYNLQTLKLIECFNLEELPKDLKNLINLRHLYVVPETVLNETPREIGRLYYLQTLPCFSVGIEGEDAGRSIIELGSLNFLRGDLRINKLENVKDATSAKRANLVGKPKLQSLELVWSNTFSSADQDDDGNHDTDFQVAVLEALHPNHNLKILKIEHFEGVKLPTWVTSGLALSSLVQLDISDCLKVGHIPSFGGLPNLERLYISDMRGAKRFGGDLWIGSSSISIEEEEEEEEVAAATATTTTAYPSLKRIWLRINPSLEEWLENMSPHFPCLEELLLVDCPKLGKMPHLFPSLKALNFHWKVGGMEERLINIYQTSLISLVISDNNDLTVLPEGLLLKNNVLENLEIRDCPKFQEFIQDGHIDVTNNNNSNNRNEDGESEGMSLALLNNSSLRTLNIRNCFVLRSLPDVWGLTSLQKLVIYECEELEAIPYGFLHFIPVLEDLRVRGCPKLKLSVHMSSFASLKWMKISKINALSFAYDDPSTIMLSSLIDVRISSIPEFVGFPVGFLQNNNHLRDVLIDDCPKFQGFCSNEQQQQLLHSTLKSLSVYDCPSASSVHLQGLVRLRELYIRNCKGLKSLEGLESLTSLEHLTIGTFSQDLGHSLSSLEDNNLISLRKLKIFGSFDLNSLPHHLQHLTTLTFLRISEFSGLLALPEWLGELASLQTLVIDNCANLIHLPSAETMQQLGSLHELYTLGSLDELYIKDCPLLQERCNNGGAEWHKISHIPHVVFELPYGESDQDSNC